MTDYLAIAAYRCFVSDVATGSLDIQVRWFQADNEEGVRRLLMAEPVHCYENDRKEKVSWQLVKIFSVDKFDAPSSGDEITGFIVDAAELAALV